MPCAVPCVWHQVETGGRFEVAMSHTHFEDHRNISWQFQVLVELRTNFNRHNCLISISLKNYMVLKVDRTNTHVKYCQTFNLISVWVHYLAYVICYLSLCQELLRSHLSAPEIQGKDVAPQMVRGEALLSTDINWYQDEVRIIDPRNRLITSLKQHVRITNEVGMNHPKVDSFSYFVQTWGHK